MADNIYGSTWTTAANTQVGSYPYINLSQTEAGHMDMKDDTPGNESMRRQHGTSGTYQHWYANGDADAVIKGNNFTVVVKNNNPTLLNELFSGILAAEKLNLLLWWVDKQDPLYRSIKDKIKWGFFNKLIGVNPVDVVERRNPTSKAISKGPVFVTAFDMV